MAAIDGYLKKERKEMIDDLARVFSPMTEVATKRYVTQIYDTCFNMCIKQKPYVREAMSLAKVMAAAHIEQTIKNEAGVGDTNSNAAETNENSEIPENGDSGDFGNGSAVVDDLPPQPKRKFIP